MSIGTEQADKIIQATIKVHGRVQQVGYRKKVNHLAQGLDLRGFVGNLEVPSAEDERCQPVGIVCQGPREKIETFLKLIEVTNGYIDVEKVEVNYEETPAMEHPDFYIHRGEAENEMGPRLDSGIVILERIDSHILDGNNNLKEEIGKGNRELKEAIDSGFDRTNESFDQLGEKIDSGFDRTNESFDRLGEKIDSGFDRTNESFDRLGEKIDSGFDRTNESFDRLDGKYHTVSDDLKGIRRAVERRLAIEEDRVEYSADGEDKE